MLEIIAWIYLSIGLLLGFYAVDNLEKFIIDYCTDNNIFKQWLIKHRSDFELKPIVFFGVTFFWILIGFYILDIKITEHKNKLKN